MAVGRCYSEVTDYLANKPKEDRDLKNKQSQEEQPPLLKNPFGSDEDDTNKTDEQRAKEVKAAVAAFARSSAKYLQDSVREWRGTEEKGLKSNLKIALDSLTAVKTAAGGEVPSTIEPIEKTAAFLDSERKFLSALAKQNENDWLEMSGVNYQVPSTIANARDFIDDWSRRLALQDRILQGFVPIAQKGVVVLNKTAVVTVPVYTPTGLNGLAVEDFIPALNDCSRQIQQIQAQLSLARSVLHYP